MSKITAMERAKRIEEYIRHRAQGATIREAGERIGVIYQTAKGYEAIYKGAAGIPKRKNSSATPGVLTLTDIAIILSHALRNPELDPRYASGLSKSLRETLAAMQRDGADAPATSAPSNLTSIMGRWRAETESRKAAPAETEGPGSPPVSESGGD